MADQVFSRIAAIRDPNPVVRVIVPIRRPRAAGLTFQIRARQLFLEPKILYRSAVEQVPVPDYELPLGSAEVLQEGKDITIVSYGPPLYTIETALHHLRHPGQDLEKLIPQDLRGLSVELIDLRTIVPYDVSRRDKNFSLRWTDSPVSRSRPSSRA